MESIRKNSEGRVRFSIRLYSSNKDPLLFAWKNWRDGFEAKRTNYEANKIRYDFSGLITFRDLRREDRKIIRIRLYSYYSSHTALSTSTDRKKKRSTRSGRRSARKKMESALAARGPKLSASNCGRCWIRLSRILVVTFCLGLASTSIIHIP